MRGYKGSKKNKVNFLISHPYYVMPKLSVYKTRKVKKSDAHQAPKGQFPILLTIRAHNKLRYEINLLKYRSYFHCKPKDWDYLTSRLKTSVPGSNEMNRKLMIFIKTAYQIIITYDLSSEVYDHNWFVEKLDQILMKDPA